MNSLSVLCGTVPGAAGCSLSDDGMNEWMSPSLRDSTTETSRSSSDWADEVSTPCKNVRGPCSNSLLGFFVLLRGFDRYEFLKNHTYLVYKNKHRYGGVPTC